MITNEGDLVKGKERGKAGTAEGLPAATLALIKQAVDAYQLPDRAAYEKTLTEAHIKADAAARAEGRY